MWVATTLLFLSAAGFGIYVVRKSRAKAAIDPKLLRLLSVHTRQEA